MAIECFPDAPAEWPRRVISDLAQVNPSYPLKKGRQYPFVEMAAVGEQFRGIERFDRREAGASGLAKFRVNDILFAKITPCPQNGKVAHVTELPDELGLGSTEFIVLSPRSSVNARFLFALTCSQAVRGRAVARMEGSTGRLRVPEDVFTKWLLVPEPPVAEQDAIAQLLDAVDAAALQTIVTIDKAKRLRQGLLQNFLTRGIGDDGTIRGPCNSDSFSTTLRVGTFPAQWRICRLDEVTTVGSGITLGKDVSGYKSVRLPYLCVANVQDGHLDLSTIKSVDVRVAEIERYSLQPGDVLMTEGGDFDKLGRGTIWEGQISPCLHQNHIFRVRANRNVLNPRFLAYIVESDVAKRYFLRVGKQTTNLATINKTQLRRFQFPVPHLPEQDHIVQILDAAQQRIRPLEDRLLALHNLKKGLMQDLLSGKIRVRQLSGEAIADQIAVPSEVPA